jgi:hypothetical protein
LGVPASFKGNPVKTAQGPRRLLGENPGMRTNAYVSTAEAADVAVFFMPLFRVAAA